MQDKFFSLLLETISETRIAPYRQEHETPNDLTCYARYLWNTALSESLYPGLQGLEVALRNSIHRAISTEFGNEDWFGDVLAEPERKVLEDIKARLIGQGKSLDVGQLVASSNFGFWSSLFNSRYEGVIWPKLLQEVFPNMPRKRRTQKVLSRRINRIRELRNRVFHHEPIWHREQLVRNHEDLLETIGWINQSMLGLVKGIDRFPEIYSRGIQGYERIMLGSLESLEAGQQ